MASLARASTDAGKDDYSSKDVTEMGGRLLIVCDSSVRACRVHGPVRGGKQRFEPRDQGDQRRAPSALRQESYKAI